MTMVEKKKIQARENKSLENKTPNGFDAAKGSLQVSLGDPAGTRTQNPLIKSQLLCQLSYGA